MKPSSLKVNQIKHQMAKAKAKVTSIYMIKSTLFGLMYYIR